MTCSMANRRTKITFPVFNGYTVHVICARDVAATGRRLKEDLSDAEAGFITHPERAGRGWLVFGKDPAPDCVAHEAFHAVTDLFRYTGVGPDEEAFAYHLDYLVGRIHKFLRAK